MTTDRTMFCSNFFNRLSQGESIDVLNGFINKYFSFSGTIDGTKIGVSDIIGKDHPDLELTSFRAMHDIYIYTRTVTAAFRAAEAYGIKEAYDLGFGSSIPTITVKLQGIGTALIVKGVDIDPEAMSVSKRNIEKLGLEDQYQLEIGNMIEFLSQIAPKKPALVLSNPPYLPFPSRIAKDYVFADGGKDGAKYIKVILEKDLLVGSIVGLNFSTLSNPKMIIELLEASYEILNLEYYQVAQGRYTEVPEVKQHILDSKDVV